MEESESLAVVAFRIENDARNEATPEDVLQPSRNQPRYKYDYNLKVGDIDRNGEKSNTLTIALWANILFIIPAISIYNLSARTKL